MNKLAALVLLCPHLALACAAVGEKGPVAIRGEEALIVWDDATKTEHFIRRAYFKDAPASFGFLVPTPTKPELAEAEASVFDRLRARYEKPPEMSLFTRGVKSAPAAAEAPVLVVEQKEVAGLDATVLRANDAGALGKWLAAHKYPSSPALEKWLAPYVKAGAYITAFKLAGGAAPTRSTAVRMSVSALAPSFPYSEPPSSGTPRPFRLSVIAPNKMRGLIGDKPWRAKVGYAASITEDTARAILDGVTPRAAQRPSWLTVFDEPRSIRGRDDLALVPDQNRAVEPSITTRIEP